MNENPEVSHEAARNRKSDGRGILIGLALALAAGSIGYRLLVLHHLEQSSALFIGLPAMLAVLLAFTPAPRSATGTILKAMTLLLLLSGVLLGEGFICILMAAPLFYLVGCIIGLLIDYQERKRRERDMRIYGLILLPFLALSLEGVRPDLSFDRSEEVRAERLVPGTGADVERALAARPRFARPLPAYLRLRFPRPVKVEGEGLAVGALRRIRFGGGEGKPGDLVLRVSEHGPGLLRFVAVSDGSHIAHWLGWKEAEIRWTDAAPGKTRVRWTLRYERRLDPAWYFGPWERYAVRLAAQYLIDTVATPAKEDAP